MTSLTQGLPLTRGIDNQLCFLIIDYMTNVNVWTKQVFIAAQYPYGRDDLASKQRPAVYCYPVSSTKDSFSYNQDGRIILELHFSLQNQRVNLAQNVIQIANLIELMNLNKDFTNYCADFMPGLFWIGKYCKVDYSKVYAKESIVKIELDYKVNLQAYINALQTTGYDITSPDEQIYQLAQTLLEEIAILDENLEPVIIT